ncbi:hypothetical protein HAX54_014997 [Datura stramonium]|uniref:Uncharacterized protein n=1 Tax=Datura stramonium TaxID=4076 RepID=A0ABS8TQM9_DATST|nr:hypothetical protein [Datura stramonium]
MTPQRTSRPRTGKQSYPTDKGKGKEKRPAKAEPESGSDPKLEESLRKAKEDQEKRAELHRRYFPKLVPEFYASYGAAQKHQKVTSPLRSRLCLEKVKDRYTWIAALIAAGTPTWVKDGGQIYKSDLNVQAKHWLGHSHQCRRYYCHRNERSSSTKTYLSSIPNVVTNLCHDTGVPEIERIDENIWVTQVVDITKIQDEMNPKLKKRKREPVVPHASKTAIGIESEIVPNHVADA